MTFFFSLIQSHELPSQIQLTPGEQQKYALLFSWLGRWEYHWESARPNTIHFISLNQMKEPAHPQSDTFLCK